MTTTTDLNADLDACPTCGQTYNLVMSPAIANPGHRVPAGNGLHSWRTDGPTVLVTRLPDDWGTFWTYTWPCGDHMATALRPAWDVATCQAAAGKPCAVAQQRAKLETRNTFDAACACCRDKGWHAVPRDGSNPPACQPSPFAAAEAELAAGTIVAPF